MSLRHCIRNQMSISLNFEQQTYKPTHAKLNEYNSAIHLFIIVGRWLLRNSDVSSVFLWTSDNVKKTHSLFNISVLVLLCGEFSEMTFEIFFRFGCVLVNIWHEKTCLFSKYRCTYTYTCIYTYIHIFVYIFVYVYVYIYIVNISYGKTCLFSKDKCIHMYVYMCIHLYVYMYI